MKLIKISLALTALFLPALVWGNDDCPCPGEQPYAGQDGCGTDVCDAADVGTYPVDCDGDGVGDECEESDCPVVTSITADLSGKEVGDTLTLSDFSITTSPENESVTLSGDLTISNGQGTVTAKASDYDDGKEFTYIGATKYIEVSYDEALKQIKVSGKILGHNGTLRVLVDNAEIDAIDLTGGAERSKYVNPDSFDTSDDFCIQTETEGNVVLYEAGLGAKIVVSVVVTGATALLLEDCPTIVTDEPGNNWVYEETDNSDYDPQRVGAFFDPQVGGSGVKLFGQLLWAKNPKVGLQVTGLVNTVYTDPDTDTPRVVEPRNSVKWVFHGEEGSDVEDDGRMAGDSKQFSGKLYTNISGGSLQGRVASMETVDLWGNPLSGASWNANISF